MSFLVNKKNFDLKFKINLNLNGGYISDESTFIETFVSDKYILPNPLKQDCIFLGWYSDPEFNEQVVDGQVVDYRKRDLYAKWLEISNYTSFELEVNTEEDGYDWFGIFSATKKDDSECIYVDWGDGNVERFTENISQLEHIYTENGTYVVRISDDINTLSLNSVIAIWIKKFYTLKKILTYSSNIRVIPYSCYKNCYNLTDIDATFNSIILSYNSLDGAQFVNCQNLTQQSFNKIISSVYENQMNIPPECFKNCSKITSIDNIPNYITSFGLSAFANTGISSLSRIRSNDYLYNGVFANCQNITNLESLEKRNIIPFGTFKNCYNLTCVNLSDWNLSAIEDETFSECNNLMSAYLPSSIVKIGNNSFRNCFLLEFNIPNNVSEIGTSAFYGAITSSANANLLCIDFSDYNNLTSFGNGAFQYCSMSLMTLPPNISSIPNNCFAGCIHLKTIVANQSHQIQSFLSSFGVISSQYHNDAYEYTGNSSKLNVGTINCRNILSVTTPVNFKTGAWKDVLLNPDKCGFRLVCPNQYDLNAALITGISSSVKYPIDEEPAIQVYDSANNLLQKDVHYTVSYTNLNVVGNASLSVTGISPYFGSSDVSFRIYDPNRLDGVELWDGGPLWATENIGAKNPEDCGYYFMYGETTGGRWDGLYLRNINNTSYHNVGSSYCQTYNKTKSQMIAAGIVDSNTGALTPAYDAAYQYTNGLGVTPTSTDYSNLINKCNWTWTTINGVSGYKVSNKSDSSKWIFLPSTGYVPYYYSRYSTSYGYYNCSTAYDSTYYQYQLYFYSSLKYTSTNYKYYARPIRAVENLNRSPFSKDNNGNVFVDGSSNLVTVDPQNRYVSIDSSTLSVNGENYFAKFNN